MGWLDGEVTTLALCWRVERRDGVAIGLTDHDRDLVVDGLVHRAAPGMTPSAIVRSDGLDADTMDIAGALTSAAIGEDDLLAGRWDGARVMLFAIDWSGSGGRVDLGEGTIGAVETRQGAFTAELAGPTAALDRPACEATSAECRAELGDKRCRVAMAGRRRIVRVVSVEDRVVTVDETEPGGDAYGGGLLRWCVRRRGSGLAEAQPDARQELSAPKWLRQIVRRAHVEPGGHLILAGILERQADELKAAYAPWLQLAVSDSEDGWILMTAQRPA